MRASGALGPWPGGSFVTRPQGNARCKVTALLQVAWPRGLTSNQDVVLQGQTAHAYPAVLRRVG